MKALLIIITVLLGILVTYVLLAVPDDYNSKIIQRFQKVYKAIIVIEVIFVWVIIIANTIILIRN